MRIPILAAVAAGALSLAACQSIDGHVASASDQLVKQCGLLQGAVAIAAATTDGKLQSHIVKGQAVLLTVCANPPRDTAGALIVVADAINAVRVAK